MRLADLDHERPRLADIVAPTFERYERPAMVIDTCGRPAVLGLYETLEDDELVLACSVHAALARGLLVIV